MRRAQSSLRTRPTTATEGLRASARSWGPRGVPEPWRFWRGGEAKVLAGGQSLVPLLSIRSVNLKHVVDINRISGLDGCQSHAERCERARSSGMRMSKIMVSFALREEHSRLLRAAVHHKPQPKSGTPVAGGVGGGGSGDG